LCGRLRGREAIGAVGELTYGALEQRGNTGAVVICPISERPFLPAVPPPRGRASTVRSLEVEVVVMTADGPEAGGFVGDDCGGFIVPVNKWTSPRRPAGVR
jgi:hypothetical protein